MRQTNSNFNRCHIRKKFWDILLFNILKINVYETE
jgi:hypothetical protein